MSHTLTLDAVQTVAADCLIANGASALQAAAVAHSIREAEAEGTRGIGLGYLPWYCGHLRVGKIAGQAVPVVRRPAPGVVQVDACDGFSHPAFAAGEAALVAAARRQGIAMMGITNAYACGVLGYFTHRLAREGLVALMFANASSTMAPWGGRGPFFGTNPWSMAAPKGDDFDAIRAAFVARQPMGRLGTAQEIGDLARFLCSPAASFITGQAIAIDGGWTI